LTDVADLKNLCEVSKTLYHATSPFLYRSITLWPWDLGLGGSEDIDETPLLPARDKGFLHYVRDITIESSFKTVPGISYIGCMHSWLGKDEANKELSNPLMSLLEGLQDGSLRSFM
jgi:hypothetical protein